MLAAPKINKDNIDISDLNKEQKKSTVIKTGKVKFFLCSFTVILFILGMALTALAANLSAKGHELNDIRRELSTLQTYNERLQLQKATMLAPQNIKYIAAEDMEMIRPQIENLRMVAAEGIGVEGITAAEILAALYSPVENRSVENINLDIANNNFSTFFRAAITNAFSNWGAVGR